MNKQNQIFTPFNTVSIKSDFPIKMVDNKLTFNNLTIICGKNGVGKSFVMKLQWLSNFFFNFAIINKNQKKVMENMGIDVSNINNFDSFDEKEFLQFCFENTFENIEEFDMELQFDSREEHLKYIEYGFGFKIKNGMIEDLNVDVPDNLLPSGPISYLSNTMRNFNRFEQYLMTKKMLNIDDVTTFENMKQMTKFFKLYEIVTIEHILNNMETSKTLNSMETGKQFLMYMPDLFKKFKDTEIKVDKEQCKIYFQMGDKKYSMSAMSAGEQSLLTMMFAI
jgi:hypothetical protein